LLSCDRQIQDSEVREIYHLLVSGAAKSPSGAGRPTHLTNQHTAYLSIEISL